jgi:hypothetical protein
MIENEKKNHFLFIFYYRLILIINRDKLMLLLEWILRIIIHRLNGIF